MGRRLRGSRGAAAVEFALCLPVLLGICGVTIVSGLALMTRMQMVSASHDAVASCASMVGTSVGAMGSCVANRARANVDRLMASNCPCALTPWAPQFTQINALPSASGSMIILVQQTISCAYNYQLPFLSLLPNGQPGAFTIQASSAAPFIPSN